MSSTTLTNLLAERKNLRDTGITFIEKSNSEEFLSYAGLYREALKGLSFLQAAGLRPQDELVLQVEDNKSFIIVFWACILGGIVPVPLSIGLNDDHKQKLFNVWAVLRNPYLLASGDKLDQLGTFAARQGLEERFAAMKKKCVGEGDLLAAGNEGQPHQALEHDIAFIQFSSGSTGSPKGVVLTHKNLITNLEDISRAARYSTRDSMISWMPLTHDMGMIGFHLNPLWSGMNQYLIPTSLFIRRPAVWLDKASQHKVSILCSPNFGYKYLLKHCSTDVTYDWDLSRVRLLYNGAEPISVKVCRNFLDALSAYGLSSRAMCPVYGLAEASLAVSISAPEDEIIALPLDRNKLQVGDTISVRAAGDDATTVVNVGKSINHCSVRIADRQNRLVDDQVIGHVQIKGDNVTAGYYNNEEATGNVIRPGGWLDTGDLGFVKDGALYITGRAKEVIFVNGQNYYPHDVERVAEEVDGIELNKIAVAGFFNDQTQREETIAFVFHRGSIPDFIATAKALKAVINARLGLSLDRVLPVKDIPRTTSGKLQRFRLLQQFRGGSFDQAEAALNQLIDRPEAGAVAGPQNDTEHKLLGIWKAVLRNDAVGVTHKFFETGGNSLKAAELGMALLKEFGCELPLTVLYAKQTVRELAGEISAREKTEYTPVPAAPERDQYPVSSAQKRLYYAWELDKTSIAYNTPVAFRITGEVNAERLQDCLRMLVARHDALRMVFRATPAGPVMEVKPRVDFALGGTRCSPARLPETLAGLVRPFPLDAGPLFRAHLLTAGNEAKLLLLDFHHIISDGVSVYHFVDELLNAYAGNALPALPIGYKDYACWEKEKRQSRGVEDQQAYWLGRLAGELPVLDMPLDFNRPPVRGSEGEKIEFVLGEAATARLRTLARDRRCTLHALMFTLYRVLLFKYTGQEDCIIGIPVAGRRHPDLQRLQGMFVNNLAIRSTLTGDPSFAEMLSAENHSLTAALDNQDYLFEALVAQTGGRRDVSRNPVFDSMFVYQNMGMPAVSNAPFKLSRFFFDPGCAKFDLSLEVFEAEHALTCSIEYATSLFGRETILRLAGHFENLMQEVLDDPGRTLSALAVMAGSEYEEHVGRFNRTQTSYPGDQTIHHLFEVQARRTPAAIALYCNGDTVTYRQLDDRANQLAALLRREGVVPGSITAILLQRSPELIVSILAVLKAGGAYLPIDADLPEGRIGYLIADSRCRVLLTTASLAGRMKALPPGPDGAPLSVIDPGRPGLPREELAAAGNAGSSTDLAYTIYTSGTTGQPKGVMIGHRSLVNYTCWAAGQYVKGEQVTFPLYTSISFDLTVTSIFTPLVTGNSIVIYGEEGQDLLLERVIRDNKSDIIKLTPSHLELLGQMKMGPARSRLRRLIVGGEQLETQLARQVYDQFGGNIEIYNEYGPTEATVGCMIHAFEPGERLPNVPIGVPAANTQLYLLDKFFKPVPTGVNGELYISGDGLAGGYLFREALTRQRFVPNPFAEGQSMYKTGDTARRLASGVIAYVGRTDQQVKINGYRIELAEIESHLVTHPGIIAAVAAAGRKAQNRKRLYAYYKPDAAWEGEMEEAAIKRYLAGRLPYYMIPARLIRIESVPLTPNGKVDYEALPEPEANAAPKDNRLPANALEALSLKIWEEVLGAKNVRVTDNFFELGGDSIKAAQISSRLVEKGIAVPAKDILTYHTIAQINPHAGVAGAARPYGQGIAEGEKALSPIEWWFVEQHFENPHYYNQSVLLQFNQRADVGRLREAFKKLIEHHDGLRMNYDAAKKVLFYNNRHLEEDFVVEEVMLEPRAAAGDDSLPGALVGGLKDSFDLAGGLLLKAACIRETGGAEMLFITAHHLVIDGVSWRILLEDLYRVYRALEKGETVKLPPKTATLIEWQQELTRQAETGPHEDAYWHETEKAGFVLPQDFATSDWKVSNQDAITGVLDKEETGFLLKEAHQAYKTDVPVLLNAALALTLKEWTGGDQFVIELENHGRHLESVDASRTVGWFTAMYPVKLELKDDAPGNQIKAVKEQLRRVPNHGTGYGTGRYLANRPGRPASRLTAIRFNYLGQFAGELNNDLFSYSSRPTGSDAAPGNAMTARMELNAMIVGGALSLQIRYNRKAHRQSTIHWFKETYFRHLASVLAHLRREEEVHFTPSDFKAAGLNDEDLAALFE